MNLYKILKYAAVALAVVAVILLARLWMAGDEAVINSATVQASVVTPFLYLSYIVLALTVILVLIFVIKGLFSGNIKNTLISIGAFILIVAIAYLLTDGTQMTLDNGDILSASASHWISAGLVLFYILSGIAVLLMVLSGAKKLIKS